MAFLSDFFKKCKKRQNIDLNLFKGVWLEKTNIEYDFLMEVIFQGWYQGAFYGRGTFQDLWLFLRLTLIIFFLIEVHFFDLSSSRSKIFNFSWTVFRGDLSKIKFSLNLLTFIDQATFQYFADPFFTKDQDLTFSFFGRTLLFLKPFLFTPRVSKCQYTQHVFIFWPLGKGETGYHVFIL